MNTISPPLGHHRIVSTLTRPASQVFIAALSLLVILVYSSALYFLRPYDGLQLDYRPDRLYVQDVYQAGPAEKAGFQAGDQLVTVDGKAVKGLHGGPLYRTGTRAGDLVTYQVQRGSQILRLSLVVGSYRDNPVLLGNLVGLHFLSASCWIIGALLCRFAAYQDVRARLIGLVWLLSGAVEAAGIPGVLSGLWGAATVYSVMWCWLTAMIVISHLYFPAPSLVPYRHQVCSIWTTVAALLTVRVVVEDWWLGPTGLVGSVILFFSLSVLLSVGLLVHHLLQTQDPEARRQTGIIIWSIVLGLAPFSTLTVLPLWLLGAEYVTGDWTVLFFLFVPLAYAYVLFQRRLVRLDFIINQVVVMFSASLMLFILGTLAWGVVALVMDLPSDLPLVGGLLAAIFFLFATGLRKAVQRRVNRILYGCHYDFTSVASSFSDRLAQPIDRGTLTRLLTQDLIVQMGILQAVLYLAEGDTLMLQPPEDGAQPVNLGDSLCQALLRQRSPVRASDLWRLLSEDSREIWQGCAWAQLFAPIVYQDRLHGLLVLGSRRSGDVYSTQDVRILAAIAHQAALAYANVRLVENLRGLAQRLVRLDEAHRKHTARDLHDTVLQQVFFTKQVLLRQVDQPAGVEHVDEAIRLLRQAIKAQRPPLLDQGLSLALQSLVEEMQYKVGALPLLTWRSNTVERPNLPEDQATALYRIMQEALTNAIKHAGARTIAVTLDVEPTGSIWLSVADDGVGIPFTAADSRIRELHYGLTGMQERALMIGAEFSITSTPQGGTTVTVKLPCPMPASQARPAIQPRPALQAPELAPIGSLPVFDRRWPDLTIGV